MTHPITHRPSIGLNLLVQLDVQLCGADHTVLDTSHGFFPP
jgi:hypothetical protein